MYFDMAVQLSDRYTALDPIKIRQTPAHEVYLLYGRTVKRNMRLDKDTDKNTHTRYAKNNTRVIKKKAGDDWF